MTSTPNPNRPAIDPSPEKEKKVSPRAKWAMLTTIGIMFPASIVVGGAIGYFLDTKLGTLPWLSAIFLVLGIAAGFVNLFRTLNKFDELSSEDGHSSSPPP